VDRLREALARVDGPLAGDARQLVALSADLVRQGVWIIGGDGWAYDIGFGGLDQVLSSGRNVNILVLDTEVYSNTGGQASKATPRGAVAKFAAAGKPTAKKDLGAIDRSYGNVFVAQVSMGANDAQVTKALLEADAWPGPSLVIAYSTCIAHGIDMSKSMSHQKDAVKSGYWPLYRFHPSEVEDGQPFKLDSAKPSIPIRDFVATETRFAILQRTDPERAAELAELVQADADEKWRYYEQLSGVRRSVPHVHAPDGSDVVVEAVAAGDDGKGDLA
jgi:pyruvate-ferredoxin/flavodoxin oxidoreductase